MARPTHYLFDIDGTLTAPRKKMSDSFLTLFLPWIEDKSIFLVAGSDMKKVDQQVPESVINRCSGIFCSMGNEFWSNGGQIYQKRWSADEINALGILSRLASMYEASPYPTKRDNWLEHRTGMINFSVAGRDSSIEERKKYSEWDKENKEKILSLLDQIIKNEEDEDKKHRLKSLDKMDYSEATGESFTLYHLRKLKELLRD